MRPGKRMLAVSLIALIPLVASAREVAALKLLSGKNVHSRGTFENARIRFETEKKGHVAFIGGSITQMNGYRPMVMDMLTKRFPDTKFVFTDAGISSTCSTTGAFRLQKHVLSKGPVDLFFVEFAVNDDQDAAHSRANCIRGMEGLIRHTRLHNPNADIVITFFVNKEMLETCSKGSVPLTSGAHSEVAKHYGIPTIDLAQETADQINAGKLTWGKFGGCHPRPIGNRLCADMIKRLMDQAWKAPLEPNAKPSKHPLPEPLDKLSYFRGKLVEPGKATIVSGMKVETPNWKALRGSCRGQFSKEVLLCGDKPGAEITLDFEGTAVGAYVLAGPDAGIVETSIDGSEMKKTDLYHRYSRGLHYPRTVMFAADLEPGKHKLKLRISADKNENSKGTAFRALYFTVN